ncbi:hypothetical protein HN873_028441 [Arachis hypogaea]
MHRRQRIGKPEVTSSSNSRRRRALAVGCGDGHTGGDDIQIFDGGGSSCGGWCGCETASTVSRVRWRWLNGSLSLSHTLCLRLSALRWSFSWAKGNGFGK